MRFHETVWCVVGEQKKYTCASPPLDFRFVKRHEQAKHKTSCCFARNCAHRGGTPFVVIQFRTSCDSSPNLLAWCEMLQYVVPDALPVYFLLFSSVYLPCHQPATSGTSLSGNTLSATTCTVAYKISWNRASCNPSSLFSTYFDVCAGKKCFVFLLTSMRSEKKKRIYVCA